MPTRLIVPGIRVVEGVWETDALAVGIANSIVARRIISMRLFFIIKNLMRGRSEYNISGFD